MTTDNRPATPEEIDAVNRKRREEHAYRDSDLTHSLVSEINATNRKYWEETSKKFQAACEKYPEKLAKESGLIESLSDDGLPHFKSGTGLIPRMIDHAKSFPEEAKKEISILNKEHAKKPRPKKSATNMGLTIDEMRSWREKNKTFDSFLDAALHDEIHNLFVEAHKEKAEFYWILWEKSDPDQEIKKEVTVKECKAKGTLRDWWGLAKNKK